MASRITDTRRIEHVLQEIFTNDQIPFPDRQAYIDQAREVSETYGADYCQHWLQAYAEDARTRAAAWSRARAAAEAGINSRYNPDAKPETEAERTPAPASGNRSHHQQRHRSQARTPAATPNRYADAKDGRPHPPSVQ